jgi:hypothetical protein
MRILAIDPGSERSAWLWLTDQHARFEGRVPGTFGLESNERVLALCRADLIHEQSDVVVIEKMESYGMPVGREVFETVRWSGRFEEACRPVQVVYLPRRTVKLHLCGTSRAKDANIRQALLDKFGGKDVAVGRKAHPGPLYGIHADLWSALALAVTYAELPIQTTLPEPEETP